ERFASDRPIAGSIDEWADTVWYQSSLRRGITDASDLDDYGNTTPYSIPMMSLFKRLPPMKPGTGSRTEILASGARDFDTSLALHAGNLLIIAQADDQPIPLDFKVKGDEVPGNGRVIYQFVLPLKR
ncbi:MAG TPA: hypothetical protein PK402_09170, partial [Tepidisphaeraceae bacterium]|nr:hypothetical protein [Tepidisphaeraceae bacterium]